MKLRDLPHTNDDAKTATSAPPRPSDRQHETLHAPADDAGAIEYASWIEQIRRTGT